MKQETRYLLFFGVILIGYFDRAEAIVNGEDAFKAEIRHPWFVILKNAYQLRCGGTVIHETWVITAAHCVVGLESIFLEFGTSTYDDYNISMTADEFFIHPQYNETSFHNDVAMIKLPTALKFSETIHPIELVQMWDRKKNFEGQHAYVYGHGIVDDLYPSDFSKNLLYAKVTVVSNQQSLDELKTDSIIDSTLCTKGFNGNNASICTGDSGGPIIMKSSDRVFLIGINSFVKEDDCMSGLPSCYARVSAYLNFIYITLSFGTHDDMMDYCLQISFLLLVINNLHKIDFLKRNCSNLERCTKMSIHDGWGIVLHCLGFGYIISFEKYESNIILIGITFVLRYLFERLFVAYFLKKIVNAKNLVEANENMLPPSAATTELPSNLEGVDNTPKKFVRRNLKERVIAPAIHGENVK